MASPRFVIYGAGGVGGTIGGCLHQGGHEVVLIARGAHYEALRARGLELRWPGGSEVLPIETVDHPSRLSWRGGDDDVVLLTMKSQHTTAALEDLVRSGYRGPVVCAQNGVANERMALRRFERVYGLCVQLPATFLEAGVVLAHSDDCAGLLDLGRYPHGTDQVAEDVAAALRGSRMLSDADPAVMGKKYGKLLMNLGNALDAACGRSGFTSDLGKAVRAEGRTALDAAGIEVTAQAKDRMARVTIRPVGEDGHKGSSSWQSLARGTGSIETDYLNGEITLLGRLHGVPTPVNAMLVDVANEMARDGVPPGSYTVEQLQQRLEQRLGGR
jgi:2-dehydropantoate 2-reductase